MAFLYQEKISLDCGLTLQKLNDVYELLIYDKYFKQYIHTILRAWNMNFKLTISKWSLLAVLMISYIHTLSPTIRPMLGELYRMKHVEETLWSTNLYLMRSWRLDCCYWFFFLVDDVDGTASKTGSIPKGNAFKIQTALHLSKHNTQICPCVYVHYNNIFIWDKSCIKC